MKESDDYMFMEKMHETMNNVLMETKKNIKPALRCVRKQSVKRPIITFIISAVLIEVFVLVITIALKHQDQILQMILSTGSILSVFLLSIQLTRNQHITECQFLDSLNKHFFDDQGIVELYDILQNEYDEGINRESVLTREWADNEEFHTANIVRYLTFFEPINILLEKGLTDIHTVDDMFGHRFMLIISNVYIQDKELFRTYYSYNNIFSLYRKWKMIRKDDLSFDLIDDIDKWMKLNTDKKYPRCTDEEYREWRNRYGFDLPNNTTN